MTLKKFSNNLFHVCPLLSHWGDDHEQTFQSFLAYKTRVPVCGAIMLNETWDKVRGLSTRDQMMLYLLVRSVCSSRAGNQHRHGVFRKEKSTNKNREIAALYERYVTYHLLSAISFIVYQVLEETGYDLDGQINPTDVVELSIKDQSLSLYIVPNVPEDYHFETRTRKEISVSNSPIRCEKLLINIFRKYRGSSWEICLRGDVIRPSRGSSI